MIELFVHIHKDNCKKLFVPMLRLLGSSSDVMHISNSLGSGGSTRLHLLSNDELRVVTRAGAGAGGGAGDDSLLESLFQVGGSDGDDFD